METQEEIRDYLLLHKDYFLKEENRCSTINDVEFFGVATNKRIIRYGERFIIDTVGRQYWVVKLLKKKHKTPDGRRKTNFKALFCVSDDVKRDSGVDWCSSYFIVPEDEVFNKYLRK